MIYSYSLPLPPSTNNLYVNMPKVGRVTSHRYAVWKRKAGWELQTQRKVKVSGPVQIKILLPEKMRGDADNRVKAIFDLLVAHDVIDDDRNVREHTVARHEGTNAIVQVQAKRAA